MITCKPDADCIQSAADSWAHAAVPLLPSSASQLDGNDACLGNDYPQAGVQLRCKSVAILLVISFLCRRVIAPIYAWHHLVWIEVPTVIHLRGAGHAKSDALDFASACQA